ncbi:MAG: indolepyruvate oxidoreductase subunit beta, partial [Thermoplasmata archaeon]|nr:indolepyruvate oxidoreductase subunit beta [Thermoplasmata archaeon]
MSGENGGGETMRKKIMIAGVGGQGIILASSIIGRVLTAKGIPVLVSEVHGMAQRGGEVRSSISLGGYHGAIPGRGEADVLLGFEPAETYKSLDRVSREGVVLTNTHPIIPPTVPLGLSEYPPVEKILEAIKATGVRLVSLDATAIAREAGSEITTNIVMLGALT